MASGSRLKGRRRRRRRRCGSSRWWSRCRSGRDGARPSRRLAEDGSPHLAAATERDPPARVSMSHVTLGKSLVSGLPRWIPPPLGWRVGGSHRRKSFKFLRKVPYQDKNDVKCVLFGFTGKMVCHILSIFCHTFCDRNVTDCACEFAV